MNFTACFAWMNLQDMSGLAVLTAWHEILACCRQGIMRSRCNLDKLKRDSCCIFIHGWVVGQCYVFGEVPVFFLISIFTFHQIPLRWDPNHVAYLQVGLTRKVQPSLAYAFWQLCWACQHVVQLQCCWAYTLHRKRGLFRTIFGESMITWLSSDFFCTFNRRYFEDNLTGCWQEFEAQSHLNDVTICLWTKDFSESHPSYCFSRAIWQGMTMIPVTFGLPLPCLWRGWPGSLRLFEHRDRLSRSRGEQNRCLVFSWNATRMGFGHFKARTFVSTCHSNLVKFDGIRMV